jgi:hypothetical protein
MTASELNILKILWQKNSVMTVKEISSKSKFEITYTYMLCKSLEKKDYIGFFTHSSCKITAKGKYMVGRELNGGKEDKGGKDGLDIQKIEY